MLPDGAAGPTADSMSLPAFYEGRARGLAHRLGHEIGVLRSRVEGEFVGTCLSCGAQLIVSIAPRPVGMRGTACNFDCATRRAIRLVHPEQVRADR